MMGFSFGLSLEREDHAAVIIDLDEPDVCLYVDHDHGEPQLVQLGQAWAGRCKLCRWVYILSHRSWRICSNPGCALVENAEQPVVRFGPELEDTLLGAYAVGGPDAVVEVLNAQARDGHEDRMGTPGLVR